MDLSVGKLERTSDDLCSVPVWKKDGVAVGNNNNKVNWPGLAQVSRRFLAGPWQQESGHQKRLTPLPQ